MADELRISTRPDLRSPVLISAFRGWNDGGQGATLAASFLAKAWNAEQFADIDPENFFDFQVSRPSVSLVGGETRRIEWPETSFMRMCGSIGPDGPSPRPTARRAAETAPSCVR